MPEFEWDENKARINLEKHSISFADAQDLFDGRAVLTFPLHYGAEERFGTVGELDPGFCTVIWTWRGDVVRLILVRKASREERRKHRQIYE